MAKLDPMMRPVPGYSLTQPKGKWDWDKPPRTTDINVAITKIIDNLEKPHVQEQTLKLMVAGVSVEEIVNTVGHMGFANGEFNPDVAELIKGPVAVYMMGLADEFNIPVRVFANQRKMEEQRQGIQDETILEIMRSRNPALYEFLERKQMEQYDNVSMDVDAELEGTFLAEIPEDEMGEEK
jgi:hypothetical protein